jgi:hypothetical protein
MPYHNKAMNSMGGEYSESFGTTSSNKIWLSDNKTGVGTICYYAHPLGPGVPNSVAIPIGVATVYAGTMTNTVAGSIGVAATAGGTFKILALM